MGEEYPGEDVPVRVLVEATGFSEAEYLDAAEELVDAGLAESADSYFAGLSATPAGRDRITGL